MEITKGVILAFQGILFHAVVCVLGKEVCDVHHRGGTYTYCEDGYHCCDNDTRCCYNRVSPGLVVGLLLAALVVCAIIAIVIYLIIRKKKTRPNRLVEPVQRVTVGTISQSNSYQFYNGPPQPPAYSQTDQHGHAPPFQPIGAYGPPLPKDAPPPPPYSQIYTTHNEQPPVYKP